jgi:carboxylate-amine ligase
MRTVGVEEELLLLDPVDGHPVAGYKQVVDEADRRRIKPVMHELKQEQAEIASDPHADLCVMYSDLRSRRDAVRQVAASQNLAVAASGTSPVSGRTTTTPQERYQRMEARFGHLERQQFTCGMHVHVSIASPQEGVAVIDRIRPWLPALVAISANSPFWAGEDTGYHSYRSIIWGQWPTSGPTEIFGGIETYRQLVTGLIASGTILDEGMIYFDARLSRHYPTVEVRVSDVCTDLAEAVIVAALCRALVDTAATDASLGVPPLQVRTEVLRIASWGAARYGLSGNLVDPVTGRAMPAADLLDGLLDRLSPALIATGDWDFVTSGVERLLCRGGGATLQLDALEKASGDLGQVALDIVERTAHSEEPG